MASDKEHTVLDRLSSRQLPVLSSGVASLLASLSDENIDFLSLSRHRVIPLHCWASHLRG